MLNHPEPDEPPNLLPDEDVLEINTSLSTKAEFRVAIKAMKNGKASGIDSICAAMLKAYIDASAKILSDLFTTIWPKDTIPAD